MLLDAEKYASVIEYGKDAVTKIRAMDMPNLSLIKPLKITIW